jgi:alkanesulfonate monooxygenase SsuD/methylene tetrahydromethanopterin reductase-like flavin-dependent oxidoreductase (luciferase family)
MKIDIILDPIHTTEEFAELGIIAEQLGFNAVLTANYPSAIDPFINFSILAKATQKIRMGPVAISPFETHPLKLSNLIYGLNQLSNGRAKIIVGGGGGTLISMGLKPNRRTMHPNMVQGVRECVEFLTGLSANKAISFNKEIFQIAGPKPQWIDQPRPQIYVAATKPKMLSMAAKVADGLMMSDVTLARIDDCMAIIDKSLKDNGRDRKTIAVSNLFSWHVKNDREEAVKEARAKLFVRGMLENWYISTFLDSEESQIVEDNFHAFAYAYAHNTDVIEGVPDVIIDKLLNHLTFTGDFNDVNRFVEEIVQFKNSGLDEFAIRLYNNPEQSMVLIAEHVVPHL